jgi:hypothetical protein
MVIVVMAFFPILVLLVQLTRAPPSVSRVVTGKLLGIRIAVSASVVLGLKLKRVCNAATMVRCMVIPRRDCGQTAVSGALGNTPLGLSMP